MLLNHHTVLLNHQTLLLIQQTLLLNDHPLVLNQQNTLLNQQLAVLHPSSFCSPLDILHRAAQAVCARGAQRSFLGSNALRPADLRDSATASGHAGYRLREPVVVGKVTWAPRHESNQPLMHRGSPLETRHSCLCTHGMPSVAPEVSAASGINHRDRRRVAGAPPDAVR